MEMRQSAAILSRPKGTRDGSCSLFQTLNEQAKMKTAKATWTEKERVSIRRLLRRQGQPQHAHQGVVQDERGQDQPSDKTRAQAGHKASRRQNTE